MVLLRSTARIGVKVLTTFSAKPRSGVIVCCSRDLVPEGPNVYRSAKEPNVRLQRSRMFLLANMALRWSASRRWCRGYNIWSLRDRSNVRATYSRGVTILQFTSSYRTTLTPPLFSAHLCPPALIIINAGGRAENRRAVFKVNRLFSFL